MFELDDGRYAVIGTDATAKLKEGLPADAAMADYERIVVIPGSLFITASLDVLRRLSVRQLLELILKALVELWTRCRQKVSLIVRPPANGAMRDGLAPV